jgi:hypothetical protein
MDWLRKNMSAPKENQNALKREEPSTSFLYVRMTPTLKGRCVRVAQRFGNGKLSDWVIKILTEATK